MKKVILFMMVNLFLLSCSQNEELTTIAPANAKTTSKLAVGQNVKLIEAKDERTPSCSRGGCRSVQTRNYVVEVANLALNKVVAVHQQLSNGQWEDINLYYSFTTTTGTEIWKGTDLKDYSNATPPTQNFFGEKLAVKYVVNGQTYWDNNNSADYTIVNSNRQANSSFLYLNNEFNVFNAALNSGSTALFDNGVSSFVNVAADVRNLAFAKEVKIVYTTNNWATTQTKSLVFNAYESNNTTTEFERWTANFSLPKTAKVTYALSYTVNGQTYWDNNFGKNYTLISISN
jgi:Carbohydrate/starch-binding module (family 21)